MSGDRSASVVRNLAPLPALTAEQAVGQLVHRVLGPVSPDRAAVLRWAAGDPANAIAAECRISVAALRRRLRLVRSAGKRTPLRPEVLAELTAVGAHTATARRARSLFDVPVPPARLPMRLSRATVTALRVLAALGPLPVDVVCAAVNRSRQPTAHLPPITSDDLTVGLRFRGASHNVSAATWSAPPGVAPAERDRRLVGVLRSRGPVTRVQLHQVLLEVGYTAKTPQTPIVDRNPLLRHTGPNRYELVSAETTTPVQ